MPSQPLSAPAAALWGPVHFSSKSLLSGPLPVLSAQPLSLWVMLVLIPKDPLPWSVCPLNSNRTGYEEECEKASSTQYFWFRKTLNISPSIQENGGVRWEPALCLVLAWLVVYLCILRGTESTGKVGWPSMGQGNGGQEGLQRLPGQCQGDAFCSRGADAVLRRAPTALLAKTTRWVTIKMDRA